MALPKYIPHYTVKDYSGWDGDWELWDGVAVAMSPSPFGPHQKLLAELSYRVLASLRQQRCDDCEVLVDCDWIIGHDTVLRPDLSIVCGTVTKRHIEITPTLIVEILSQRTRDKDQTAKRDRYADQGVAHYVMCDPDDGTTQRLLLRNHRYTDVSDRDEPIPLHPGCALPAATFDLQRRSG